MYPVYIVSKGRWENPITAKCFLQDGVDFKIVVEPQEYDNYCEAVGKKNVLKLPFSNLGLGSYPARNFCMQHREKKKHNRHWIFDDNIDRFRRVTQGTRIPCNAKLAIEAIEHFTDRYENEIISGFDYCSFVVPGTTDNIPFRLNVHVYSALLIKNNTHYKWRLKYNEDVDLCLQVMADQKCTLSFKAFCADKRSTTAKMKGGNQTDLYKNNSYEKKILKTRSLEEVWPQYVKTKIRYNRPHHYVNWNQFGHPLIRRKDIDWKNIKFDKKISLKKLDTIKNQKLQELYEKNK